MRNRKTPKSAHENSPANWKSKKNSNLSCYAPSYGEKCANQTTKMEMRSSHARSEKQRKNYVPLIQPTRIEMHSCSFVSWRSWTSRSYGEPRMRTNAGEFELFFSRTGFWLVPIARFRTRRTPHSSVS